MSVSLFQQVVHEDDVAPTGGHFAFREFDEGVKHDFRATFTKFLKGEADLLGLQFVVFAEHVDQFVALRPFPLVVGDVSRSVKGGAVASAVEEFGLTFEATLPQIQELSTVISDAIDVQRTQRFHESSDITVGDKDRLFGEPVKANSQSTECLKHAVKNGLVGVFETIQGRLRRRAH